MARRFRPRSRFAVPFIVAASAACSVEPASSDALEEPVETAESALPLLPFCVGPTAMPEVAHSPPVDRSGARFRETVDLLGPGDRSDFAWSEATLSPPSGLYSRVTVTSTTRIDEARIELNMSPFGYVAGGVNLLLEVKDGARVLCQRKLVLVEGSTVAFEKNDAAARGTRTLSCSFDASGLARAPVARTSLEAWATLGGVGTAYVRATGGTPQVTESKCMSLPRL